MRILTLCPHYLPGNKAGGPVRSIASLVERLGDEFEFLVVSYNHDFGDRTPYPAVHTGEWHSVGKAKVLYLDRKGFLPWRLAAAIRRADPDLVYLNSFFHPTATIGVLAMRQLKKVPKVPFVLAPKGEFSPGALQIKPVRKGIFRAFARLTGLYSDLVWQASTDYERSDILRFAGSDSPVVVTHVAPDLASITVAPGHAFARHKVPGRLKALFVGRIAPKKNLDYAVRCMRELRGDVVLTVLGPLEDPGSVARAREEIAHLPANIRVELVGSVSHEEVLEAVAEHELFFFPTRGENFGHVILEALHGGCPVLLSDQTPWRDLRAKGAGDDLPLQDPGSFTRVLQEYVDMDAEAWQQRSDAATRLASAWLLDEAALDQNRRLFTEAVSILNRALASRAGV